MSVPARVGVAVPLVMILEDGSEDKYPQAEIYGAGGTFPVTTLSLSHTARGRYEAEWVPSAVGAFSAVFITYVDAGHSIESIVYTREVEQVFVTQSGVDDLAAAVTRLLGLNHENAFIDNTVFDVADQLLSARIRLYDSKVNAEAATDGDAHVTGLIATYTMTAEHEGLGKLKSYRYVKE